MTLIISISYIIKWYIDYEKNTIIEDKLSKLIHIENIPYIENKDIRKVFHDVKKAMHYWGEFETEEIAGYQVQTLESIYELKKSLKRGKDKDDLNLIMKVLGKR